jgi:hypothetical protein
VNPNFPSNPIGLLYYFERMKKPGLYATDKDRIQKKIKDFGLKEIFS